MVKRVCATRESKENPNVYTVKRLREKAIKEGHEKSLVNKLNKSNLCALLNIKWVGKPPKGGKNNGKTTKNYIKIKATDEWGSRQCNVRKSEKYPNAFDKVELVKLALKHLSLKNANNYTKQQLCFLLEDGGVSVSKISSVKKASKKKKVAKKKAVKKTKKEDKKGEEKEDKKGKEVDKPSSPPKKMVKKTVKKPKSPIPLSKPKKSKKKPTSPKNVKKVKKPASPKKVKKVKNLTKENEEDIEYSKFSKDLKGDCIERSKLKLKEHQKTLVNHLRTHRGIIAAFDVGSGKTLTGVAASQCYLDEHPKGKVIVVTPKSLQENFKKELEAYGGRANDKRYEFYTIRKFATTYKNGCPKEVFLIIDEAHNLRTTIKGDVGKGKGKKGKSPQKGETINNAKVAVRCAKSVDKVLLLTATPLYNKPHDLINLVAMVKGTDPLTKAEFERKNPQEMCDYFRDTLMYFQNPVSDEYPEKVEHTIRVIMNPEFYKGYREVEERKSDLWSSANPWTFLTVVRQATNAVDPCLKCEWAVRKIMEGNKTLVYSAFVTHGVKKLQGMLDDLGIKYVEVTGSMSMEGRKEAVKQYNSDKVKVMFITKAGGEGLDLKGTRNIILLEKSWNRPNEEQIIGRGVRYRSHMHLPKDERRVDVYHLIIVKPAPQLRDRRDQESGKDSADEMLDQLTKEKEAQNANFQLLLRSVSIDAPAGTKCPPPLFKEIEFNKKKAKEDKYKVTIIEHRVTNNTVLNSAFGISKERKDKIIKLSGKSEKEVKFKTDEYRIEIDFTSKAKGRVPALVRDIVNEFVVGSQYYAKGRGSWGGDTKTHYIYEFEKRFK